MTVQRRKVTAGAHLRRDTGNGPEAVEELADQEGFPSPSQRAVRRWRPPPARALRGWLFTVLFLMLIGLLAGIMLGGLIST